jgi:hypothetical protein
MRKLLFYVTTAYTILLITRPQEFVPSLSQSPLLQVMVLAAFAVWLMMPGKGAELPHFRLLPLLLVFVWLSLGIGGGWWGGIVPALEKLLPPMLLFVIISGSVRTVDQLRAYSTVVIACACVLVLHGHFQVTTGIGWTGQPMIEGRITYSGIFNDPNDIGLLLVMSIALSLFHFRTQERRLWRLLFLVAFGWLLYGVYLTDSRGTMLATMTVLGLEAWRAYGKFAMITAGSIAVPLLVAFTRLAELNAEEDSAENRVEAWYDGVQMLVGDPVFGIGWGLFGDVHGMTAHNSFVLAMAELGLAGYTVWLAFVVLTGWMIFRLALPRAQPAPPGAAAVSAPEQADSRERLAAYFLLFGLAGFGVGAFFLSQSYKAMLFMNCGLIVGRFLGQREAGLPVPRLGFGMQLPRMFTVAIASVVGMWLLVRVLL